MSFVNDERESPKAAEPNSDASTTPATVNKDVVMIHSPHDDGEGYNVLRMRDGSLELGAAAVAWNLTYRPGSLSLVLGPSLKQAGETARKIAGIVDLVLDLKFLLAG